MCLKEEVFIQLIEHSHSLKQTNKKTEVNTNETIKADRIQSKCTINYAMILMSILGPRGVYRIYVKDVQTFSFSHCCKLNRRYLDLTTHFSVPFERSSGPRTVKQAKSYHGAKQFKFKGHEEFCTLVLSEHLGSHCYTTLCTVGVFFCFFLNGSFKQVSPHEPFLKVPNNVWCGCDKL